MSVVASTAYRMLQILCSGLIGLLARPRGWVALCGALVATALVAQPSLAQVGPGAVVGPVNVPAGSQTVVGSTTISSTGTNAGVNVTGTGVLTFDATTGPSPGPIAVQTVNGNALQAASGGTILIPFPGLTVQSGGGHAVLANGSGSTVTFNNGATVGTTGVGSSLVAIGTGATVNATGVTVTNTGVSSAGHGAVAESGGIINLHAGTSITTTAFNSIAIGASGAGSQVNTDAIIPVTINGRGGMAVYMHDGGLVSLLPNSVFNLNGTSSVGIVADNTTVASGTIGSGLTINLNGTGVAGQAGSTGIYAVNGGNLAIANVTITGQNAAAGVWAATGSTITLTGQNAININSEQNQAAYALSPTSPNIVTASGQINGAFTSFGAAPIAGLYTSGGTINSTGTTINVTSNNFATGVEASNGGVVNLTANTIVTTGTNSTGIRVDSGGTVNGDASSVTTSGGGAGVAFNSASGTVALTNTTVLATGAGSEGMTALNFSVGGTNTFSMSGGSLTSQDSTGMAVQGPIDITFSNGATATGGNGFVIAAFDNPGGFQQTNVQLLATTGSTLLGDAFAQSNSILDISLLTGARWTGAAFDVTNVTTGATGTWTITDDSTVTGTVSNAGVVEFIPPGSGPFRTLSTQNYVGLGGILGLNTFLGSDASPSDILIINGGTGTGASLMRVTNAGGLGALTVANGILVVEAVNGGMTQPGLFTLAGPVAAGPFEYSLYRGAVDGTAPDSWYLRSVLNCDLAPTHPLCGPVTPDYRPETSLYAALPAMALLYGRLLIDTLHERVGEEEHLRGLPHAAGAAPWNGAWGRVIGQHGEQDGGRLGIFGSGPSYEYDLFALQAGQDLYRRRHDDGARTHAGIYGAIGTGRGDVTHFPNIRAGKDEFEAYSLGAYRTYFGPEGWYVDSLVQGTRYNMRGLSGRFPTLNTDGWGFGASLESGYPIPLGNGWRAEPQAQLVYQAIALRSGGDGAARVSFDDVNSLSGRIGVRFANTWLSGNGASAPNLVTAWLRPNLWHEFLGDPRTRFSSADGLVSFRSDIGGSWIELNAGITAQLNATTALYLNGSYDVGFDGDSTAYNGKLGVRISW